MKKPLARYSKMKQLIRLGPAGSDGNTLKGIQHAKDIGLHALEIEFTHGVNMSNELAKEAGNLAEKLGIKLSIHAPYFINLASEDKEKIENSKKRLLLCCERAHYLKARYVIFHAGYYGKRDKEEAYQIMKESLKDLIRRNTHKEVSLICETSGKTGSFGNLDELLRLRKEIGVDICVDFGHVYAIQQGKIDYSEVLSHFKGKHLHSHFTGIEYGEKGERRHINMSKPDFKELAEELIKNKQDITIISESPITWEDSLKQKEILEKIGYHF